MSEEMNSIAQETQPKTKRPYVRRQPIQIQQQPIAQNPAIIALENDIAPLVNQRLDANRKVQLAAQQANLANLQLDAARNELQNIESEIQFRMQTIAQMRNGGIPVPQALTAKEAQSYRQPYSAPSPAYNPVTPYPSFGVSSLPGRNDGLYPDASPRGFTSNDPEDMINSASAQGIRMIEMKNRDV